MIDWISGCLAVRRWGIALVVVSAALVALLPASPAFAESGTEAQAGLKYFERTEQYVSGDFLTFFTENGGVVTFGYPLTAVFEEDGRKVQYFERARMEFWPENKRPDRVRLSRLGDLLAGGDPPIQESDAPPGARFFEETGHSLAPEFEEFFDDNGGLAVFGNPIGEPEEHNNVLSQRFQQMVLELDLRNNAENQIEPRQLGKELLERRRLPLEVLRPASKDEPPDAVQATGWVDWSSWQTYLYQWYGAKQFNMRLASEFLNGTIVEPGESLNYSAVLQAHGLVFGLCYGGDGYLPCFAGGSCGGATAFYRAWFNSGLEIVEVASHTREAYWPLGWDATVYTPAVDLVVRNNSRTPIRILSGIDEDGFHYFQIQGRTPAPWTVERIGPLQRGAYTYEVGRKIFLFTGELYEEEWRTVNYVQGPPPEDFPEGF